MRLLVSVTCAAEASAALAGGADVIDAKDPLAGALGAVSVEVLHEIYAAVARQRPLTAALGDAGDEAAIERAARTCVAAGAALVKVGFAGIASAGRVATLTTAAVRGAKAVTNGNGGVVAVAYADADRAASLAPADLVEIAARGGREGPAAAAGAMWLGSYGTQGLRDSPRRLSPQSQSPVPTLAGPRPAQS